MSSLPLPAEKDTFFWEFPQQKMNKKFGNPMSSLGGVPLISGIAQCQWFSKVESNFPTLPLSLVLNFGFN